MPDLPPGTPVVARGRRWCVRERASYDDCTAIRLETLIDKAPEMRTLLAPFDRIEPLPITRTPGIAGRRRWARAVLRATAAARPFGSLAAAAGARIDLLSFQLEPALALRRHGRTRVLVADDVGLGKTIQAGLIVAELVREQAGSRVVILAPAGLRDQWRQELHDRFGVETILADTAWLASTVRQLPPEVNPWALPGVYVTSFDLTKRPEVLRPLEEVTWDLAVVDEAHACTPQTARRAAIHGVAARARRVVLLTATPPDGDPRALDALRGIGELPGDPPVAEFRRTRADVQLDALPRRSSIRRVRLSPAERRMHRLLERYTALVWEEAGARADQRARLAALVLRKRALSSAGSLGASLQRRLELLNRGTPVDDGPAQLTLPLLDEDVLEDAPPDAVIGAAGLADAARERHLLARLARATAQAIRSESKIRFLLRLVRRAREPLIVFTEYRDTLQQLERACVAGGLAPVTLHGGMSAAERTGVQQAFNRCGSLLLATDAASEGVNLHHRCRAVVHFELPWTLSRLRQRTGRVDRFGQRRRVHEILLVAQHTAERLVLEPLVRRAHLARSTEDQVDRLVDRLTEADVGAAVMDDRTVRLPAALEHRRETIDLHDEAIAESTRIAFERRVSARCGASAGPQPRLMVMRSKGEAGRFELVAAVRLEDGTGRVLHTLIARLALDCRLRQRPCHNADWRKLGGELSVAFGHLWQPRLLEALHREIEGAIELHRLMTTVATARDDAILDGQTSVARQLVQAGLFDRRALRERERLRSAAAVFATDAKGAAGAAAPTLHTTVVPVAVR